MSRGCGYLATAAGSSCEVCHCLIAWSFSALAVFDAVNMHCLSYGISSLRSVFDVAFFGVYSASFSLACPQDGLVVSYSCNSGRRGAGPPASDAPAPAAASTVWNAARCLYFGVLAVPPRYWTLHFLASVREPPTPRLVQC